MALEAEGRCKRADRFHFVFANNYWELVLCRKHKSWYSLGHSLIDLHLLDKPLDRQPLYRYTQRVGQGLNRLHWRRCCWPVLQL